jgi:hypothetical protein
VQCVRIEGVNPPSHEHVNHFEQAETLTSHGETPSPAYDGGGSGECLVEGRRIGGFCRYRLSPQQRREQEYLGRLSRSLCRLVRKPSGHRGAPMLTEYGHPLSMLSTGGHVFWNSHSRRKSCGAKHGLMQAQTDSRKPTNGKSSTGEKLRLAVALPSQERSPIEKPNLPRPWDG